jgi:hypothetical protein
LIAHRRLALPTLAGLALVVATLAGCGAREGGVCQIDGDCATGLHCCKNSMVPESRGVCRVVGTTICATTVVDAAFVDAGDTGPAVDGGPDGGSLDGSIDAPIESDGGAADAASETDAEVDAAPATDAAAADDADIDAGP